MPSHIERLLRATQSDTAMPESKRMMELNPDHALIQRLATINQTAGHDEKLDEWIELLFDQALLTEGSPVTDPARFATRMTGLLLNASVASTSAS
jgi:molecular chaperone HtpG